MAGLYLLSSIPGTAETTQDQGGIYRLFLWIPASLQNLFHLPLYGGLAWLWCNTLSNRFAKPWHSGWLAIALASGFGLFDEWHQLGVPGRYASLTDLVLNCVGALIAVGLYKRIASR